MLKKSQRDVAEIIDDVWSDFDDGVQMYQIMVLRTEMIFHGSELKQLINAITVASLHMSTYSQLYDL